MHSEVFSSPVATFLRPRPLVEFISSSNRDVTVGSKSTPVMAIVVTPVVSVLIGLWIVVAGVNRFVRLVCGGDSKSLLQFKSLATPAI